MADHHLKVRLAPLGASQAVSNEFENAESGHKCDPDKPGCLTFRDGMTVNVRRDSQGNLILYVTEPSK